MSRKTRNRLRSVEVVTSWRDYLRVIKCNYMRRVIPAKYTATIVLDTPLPAIGNRLQFALGYQDDAYVILGMLFEPGWRMQDEQ